MLNVISLIWKKLCGNLFQPSDDRWQDQSDHIKRDSWQDI